VNYEEDKLTRVFFSHEEAKRGSELHAFAQQAIQLRIRQIDNQKTLNQYINDAIGYRMIPEQTLYYSENVFGTADAIGFEKDVLRIHDLKNGRTVASPRQLQIYAALFCLEYRHDPKMIQILLRIYQNNTVTEIDHDPAQILFIMEKIKHFDKRIRFLRMEVSY
jgi:hypothetical protein